MTRRASGLSEAIGLAVAEGALIAVIGFLGAELMLAPAGVSLSALESLAPALVAGVGAGLFRFSQYVPRPEPVERASTVRRELAGQISTRGQRSRRRAAAN